MGGHKAGYGHTTMIRTGDRIRTAVSFILRIGRVDQAIEVGVKYIWMQDGVISPESAAKAEAAGIPVIMDD